MTFCHSPRSFVSKVVFVRRSIIIGEEEMGITTSKGQKKKRQFEREVH
jgi:hypothetical protein